MTEANLRDKQKKQTDLSFNGLRLFNKKSSKSFFFKTQNLEIGSDIVKLNLKQEHVADVVKKLSQQFPGKKIIIEHPYFIKYLTNTKDVPMDWAQQNLNSTKKFVTFPAKKLNPDDTISIYVFNSKNANKMLKSFNKSSRTLVRKLLQKFIEKSMVSNFKSLTHHLQKRGGPSLANDKWLQDEVTFIKETTKNYFSEDLFKLFLYQKRPTIIDLSIK